MFCPCLYQKWSVHHHECVVFLLTQPTAMFYLNQNFAIGWLIVQNCRNLNMWTRDNQLFSCSIPQVVIHMEYVHILPKLRT